MDEEESEEASAPATPQKLTSSDDAAVMNSSMELSTTLDTNTEQRKETAVATECTSTTSGQTRPAPAADAAPLEANRLQISAECVKVATLNVRGLASRKKQTQLYRLVMDHDLDIIAVQETIVESEDGTETPAPVMQLAGRQGV
ncbi:hypothetical protein HPB52_012946 [Rhipicephalus sanguineus]|uniref:Uncharacterized protein n=1 Tax=Rhipicephalus sanguineus TaxID=34632 RepID=A0A9D4PU39_RHISA|nr:hypothetical protein HPB52_012946 [Rhipicephalus sanguineus]